MTELDTLYKALDNTDTTHSYKLHASSLKIRSTPRALHISTATIHAMIFITLWTAGVLAIDHLTDDMWLAIILAGLVTCAASLLWALKTSSDFSETHALSLKPDTVTTLDFAIPPHIIAAYNTDTYRNIAQRCIDTLYALHQDTLLNDQEKHTLSQRCIEKATVKIAQINNIRQESLSEYIDTWKNRIDEL